MKWIKCADKLPRDNQEVLCIFNGRIELVCFQYPPVECGLEPDWVNTSSAICYDFKDVTYWMPLPSLPDND